MKPYNAIILICVSCLFIGCATYPNYYVQDSTITQQTIGGVAQPIVEYNPLGFIGEILSGASVFANSGPGYFGGGWGANPWIPNGPYWVPPQPGWNYNPYCY